MDEDRTTKKVFNAHHLAHGRKGRPNLRWIDGLGKDIPRIGDHYPPPPFLLDPPSRTLSRFVYQWKSCSVAKFWMENIARKSSRNVCATLHAYSSV
ncbi:hypothetical protein TNCV_5078561 [Trichonephila clavipes]|nr:hypothetical protein TNCV_5078561 [Trichonephila clavipes]